MEINITDIINKSCGKVVMNVTDYLYDKLLPISSCGNAAIEDATVTVLEQMKLCQKSVTTNFNVNREVTLLMDLLNKLTVAAQQTPLTKKVVDEIEDTLYNTQKYSALDLIMSEMHYYADVLSNSDYDTPVFLHLDEWGQNLALAAYIKNPQSKAFTDTSDLTRVISLSAMYTDFTDSLSNIDATNLLKLLLQPKGSPMLFSSSNQTTVHQISFKVDDTNFAELLDMYKVSNMNIEVNIEPDSIVDIYSVFTEEQVTDILLNINKRNLDGPFLGLRDMIALEFMGELYVGTFKSPLCDMLIRPTKLRYTINISTNHSAFVNCEIPLNKLIPLSGTFDILPIYAHKLNRESILPFITTMERSMLSDVSRGLLGIPKQLILESGRFNATGNTIATVTQNVIENLGVGRDLYTKLLNDDTILIQGGI